MATSLEAARAGTINGGVASPFFLRFLVPARCGEEQRMVPNAPQAFFHMQVQARGAAPRSIRETLLTAKDTYTVHVHYPHEAND